MPWLNWSGPHTSRGREGLPQAPRCTWQGWRTSQLSGYLVWWLVDSSVISNEIQK